MSSASMPPHVPYVPYGFTTVRGRGYRPGQVDAFVVALSDDRDAAWERAARLTVLAREMEEDLEDLREVVAELRSQTYELLGERARRLFLLGEEEAADVRERARGAGREELARAETWGDGLLREAREYADGVRAEAEEEAGKRLAAARAEADEIRVAARREVKERRAEVLAVLREVRQRTAALLAEQEREQAERCAAVEQETAEREAAFDAGHAEAAARAEAALAEARQELADAEESVRRQQEEATARAAEIVDGARADAERVARETERLLREHGERWDDVQAQMDQVRDTIAALTGGRAIAE
ncbi:MAG: cellulose-binding protein [Streptomyces sp.]|nr:cellulose-binding protein [Streptomyces sp.]